MRKKQICNASTVLEILNQQWLDSNEIKLLTGVGIDKARIIKNEIRKKLEEEKIFLPPRVVPTDKTIEYLGINISYLKKISRIQQEQNKEFI